jgi:alkane 1-monooxygenase
LASAAVWRYVLPILLLLAAIAAMVAGGIYVWLALVAIVILGMPLDEAIGDDRHQLSAGAKRLFIANLALALPLIAILTALLVLQFTAADPIGIKRLVARPGIPFGEVPPRGVPFHFIAIVLVGELYASAGVAAGHELVHWTSNRWALIAGRILLAFTLDSAYSISHVYAHHRAVGLWRDPATARRGESVYAFFLRTNVGQIREAFAIEAERLRRKGAAVLSWRNRAIRGQLYSLAIIAAAFGLAGWAGVGVFLAAALFGRFAHQTITYFQHYGLVRAEGTPIAARHSWDSGRLLSNAMLHNVPHHAGHHLSAGRHSWEVVFAGEASPILPRGYRGMFVLACIPPLYRMRTHPLLRDWDARLASDAERVLIRERGWEIPAEGTGRRLRREKRAVT